MLLLRQAEEARKDLKKDLGPETTFPAVNVDPELMPDANSYTARDEYNKCGKEATEALQLDKEKRAIGLNENGQLHITNILESEEANRELNDVEQARRESETDLNKGLGPIGDTEPVPGAEWASGEIRYSLVI